MGERRDLRQLTTEKKFELARAVFQREYPELRSAATTAFRKAYPTATEEMINNAIMHIYTDGIGEALEFIAEAEMFLRDPHEDWLNTYDLLYHTYNWHMFQALLPDMTQELVAAVDSLKRAIERGTDPKKLLEDIKDLRDQMTGDLGLPRI